ncbi:MAG: tetratricopeptide repeat protein, partial [Deltaproteobacteria bacterium]|nr:tetratricopeptide repeat protein [Deltaproteobacteria bacterium]
SLAPLWAALVAGAAVLGGVAIAQDDAPVCPRATEQFTGVWDEATRTTMAQALASASPSLGTPTWARVEPIVGDHVSRWLDLRQQSCRSAEEGALSAELLDLRMACLDTRHNELSALLETWADADAEIVAHAVEASVQLTPLSTCRDPRILRELTPPGPSGAQREQGEAIRKQIDRARALRRGGKSAQALTIVGAAVDAAVALDDPTTTIEARLERGRIRAELADRDGATADFDAVIEQGGQARYLSAVAEAAVALVDVVGVDLARVDAGLDLARTASVAVALGSDATLMRARLDLARGRVLYLAGRTEEGLAATRRGMELLGGPQADERARLQQAEALQLLAKMALAKDDPKAAHDNAQRALAIFEQLLGDDHPQVATSLAHGAAADLRAGRVEQARAQFARAARIQRDAYGPRHPAYGRTVANLGSALREAYDFEGARRQYREAADILEDALGADDPRVATVWANIGAVEFELHDLPAAEAAYVRGLAGLRKSMGERHPQTALTLANLGRAQLERGHVEQASTTLRQALSIREEVLGTDHVQTARSRVSLAHALMAQHRHADAVDAYTAALEVLEARRAPPTEVASARAFLGRAQWENGERRVARALFERARPGLSEADRADHDAWCDGRCGSG